MKNKKQRLIKQQNIVIRFLWTTFIFLSGFMFAVWMAWMLAGVDILHKISVIMNVLLIVFFIELIIMVSLFLAIGRTVSPKSTGILEQIEKLGILNEKGLITEDEFKKEKMKLWDDD